MKHRGIHVLVWTLLRPAVKLLTKLLFNYKAIPARPEGPFLLVSNHNTDWDPLLVACSFPRQMYFVTSEHLLRSGLAGRLIAFLQDPIARQKSGNASDTVMAILRRLKAGYNVALFPEGNRSWDGVTQKFPPATGKMARTAAAAGASLVTYRLEGCYFANPRWAGPSLRRGRAGGRMVNVYTPQQLRAMTPTQVNEAICRDIFEDAYARQRSEPAPFRGRRLAEHLETLFFLCPRCGRVHTLQSAGDRIRCTACDFQARYLPTGFLEGEGLPWDNLRDWNLWQTGEIERMCDEAGQEAIFTDSAMECSLVESSRGLKPLGTGDMALYRHRLELPGATLPLPDITGIALRGPQDIYFSAGDVHYEVRSRQVRCVQRYLTAISHLRPEADFGV